MRRLYIRGLVKMADAVRGELAQPITPQRLSDLQQNVSKAISGVRDFLAENRATVRALPGPSRKAHRYLSNLDFSSVRAEAAARSGRYPAASVRFEGLRSHFDSLLDTLGRSLVRGDLDTWHTSICATGEGLRQHVEANKIDPQHLTPQSRHIKAWFEYFSDRKRLEQYVGAVGVALRHLNAAANRSCKFGAPVTIHFRPLNSLYRARSRVRGTRVMVPTPMIGFDAEGFTSLASVIFTRSASKETVLRRTLGAPYRAIQVALAILAGEADPTAGAFHDLAVSFERVKETYFDASMARPRLLWSRQVTGCKFGHYEPANDTLMVSSSLDSPEVEACVVDFIVYHELLHKQLGFQWKNGRQASHTLQFRRLEKRFEQFGAAQAALRQLAELYA